VLEQEDLYLLFLFSVPQLQQAEGVKLSSALGAKMSSHARCGDTGL
jgi:hypothetical protein